jgi:phosphohistidine phosphatase SixA
MESRIKLFDYLMKVWHLVIRRLTAKVGMKRLIIARHGDYAGLSLTSFGQQRVQELGEVLKGRINGGSVLILSSEATRARESAEILGNILGVGFEENPILGTDYDYRERMGDTLDLVLSKKDGADVVILVTHLEFTEEFPPYFGMSQLGVRNFPSREIRKAQAWDIDCEQKTIALVN